MEANREVKNKVENKTEKWRKNRELAKKLETEPLKWWKIDKHNNEETQSKKTVKKPKAWIEIAYIKMRFNNDKRRH